jgi:hypothetical protein
MRRPVLFHEKVRYDSDLLRGGHDCFHNMRLWGIKNSVFNRVVDPDPDWIRIQRLCGSRSVLGIRIPDLDPGVRKLN